MLEDFPFDSCLQALEGFASKPKQDHSRAIITHLLPAYLGYYAVSGPMSLPTAQLDTGPGV